MGFARRRYRTTIAYLFAFFQYQGETFGTLFGRVRDAVGFADKNKDTIHTFFEELFIHVFCTTCEEEIKFDAMSFREPFGDTLCFECQIVVPCADFDLNDFCFGCAGVLLDVALFFSLFVLVFAIIGNAGNGGYGIGGDFYKVKAESECFFYCLTRVHNA